MIFWALGLACAIGIVAFHFLNLARFSPVIFNQFEVILRLTERNRTVRNLQSLLILLLRLALVAALTFYIAQCARPQAEEGSKVVILPEGRPITTSTLTTWDSIINRSGIANATKSNIYSQDLRIKTLFPSVVYQADNQGLISGLRAKGFVVDSLVDKAVAPITLQRSSDSSFILKSAPDAGLIQVKLNGKALEANKSDYTPLAFRDAINEVETADGQAFYFTKDIVSEPVFVQPGSAYISQALDPAFFKQVASLSQAALWLGAYDLPVKTARKAVLYIPRSAEEATTDLKALGFEGSVTQSAIAVQDTFSVLDKSYLKYAFVNGGEPEVPTIWGRSQYALKGYSIPVLQSSLQQPFVSLVPNSQGNSILFVHGALDKVKTNLPETELFLPLLYSLMQRVAQSGKVTYYDLCSKQDASWISEQSAKADAILYKKGLAKPFLSGPQIKILLPGIYTLVQNGDSISAAVNAAGCQIGSKPLAYVLSEPSKNQAQNHEGWLLCLLVTFAVAEGVALWQRVKKS